MVIENNSFKNCVIFYTIQYKMTQQSLQPHRHRNILTKATTLQFQPKDSPWTPRTHTISKEEQICSSRRTNSPYLGKTEKLPSQPTLIPSPQTALCSSAHEEQYPQKLLKDNVNPTIEQISRDYQGSLARNSNGKVNTPDLFRRTIIENLQLKKANQPRVVKKALPKDQIVYELPDKLQNNRGDINCEATNLWRQETSKRDSTSIAQQRLRLRQEEVSKQKFDNKDEGTSFKQQQNLNTGTIYRAEKPLLLSQNQSAQCIELNRKNMINIRAQEGWKAKFEKTQLDMQRLQKENKDLRGLNNTDVKYQYYLNNIKQKQQHNRKLVSEKTKLNAQIMQLRKNYDKLSQQNHSYKKQIQSQKVQKIIQNCYNLNQLQKVNDRNFYPSNQIIELNAKLSNSAEKYNRPFGQLKVEKDQCKSLNSPSVQTLLIQNSGAKNYNNNLYLEKEYEGQLMQLRHQNQSLKKRITQQAAKVSEFSARLADLEKQRGKINQENLSYQKQVQMQKIENNRQIAGVQHGKANIDTCRSSYETKINQFVSKLSDYSSENKKLKDQIQSLKSSNSSLSVQLFKLQSQLDISSQAKSALQKVKDQLQMKQNSFKVLQGQICSLKRQLNECQQKIKKLEKKKVQDIQNLQFEHKKTIIEMDTLISTFKLQLFSKEKAYKAVQSDIPALTLQKDLQLRFIQYQSKQQSQNVIKLSQERRQSQIHRLEKDIYNQRGRIKIMQFQVQRLTVQLQQLRKEKDAYLNAELVAKQKIKNLQSNNKILSKNLEEARTNCNNLLNQRTISQKDLNKQPQNNKKVAQELQLYKQQKAIQISSLQNQITRRDNTNESLKKVHNNQYNLLIEENRKLKKKIQQKLEYEQEMQKNIESLQQNINELRLQNQRLEKRTKQLELQNDGLNEKYTRFTNQRRTSLSSKQEISNLQLQNSNSKKLVNQLEQTLLAQKNKTSSLQKGLQDLKRQFNQLQKSNKKIKNDLSQVLQTKAQLEKDLKQMNLNYAALESQRNKQKQTNTAFANQELKRLQIKSQSIVQANEALNKSKIQLQKQVNVLKQQNTRYISISGELASLKSTNFELEAKLRDYVLLKQRNQKQQLQLNQLKSKLLQLQKSNRDLPSNLNQLQKKSSQAAILRQQKSKIQKEFYRLKEFHIELEQKHLKLCSQIEKNQKLSLPAAQPSFRYLFHGEVLRGEDEHKLFLKQCIQKHQKIQILDARLIYRYEPLNKQNVHRYIDQKPHLVLVVKLANGFFLAGYAEGIFKPRTPSQKEGLIMSLTNRKCYYLMERNKRAISYDDFFVIFGNSEIRIKSQEKKVFSNFGVSNSYYRHNGDGVNVLLGGTKSDREMQVESYEFFQLILKQ